MAAEKIKIKQDLNDILAEIKAEGKVIGFTNGCFDILHLGHIRYMASAKAACDVLVVGVNSDGSVKRLKGDSRPVNTLEARMGVLSAVESIDYVVAFEEDTPVNLIETFVPDVLFKGGDWNEEDVVGGDIVKANNGKVMIIKFEEGYSTTEVIEKIKKEK